MEEETISSIADDDRVWDIGINTDGLMDGVTGRVGNFVFRTLNGMTVVSRRPKKPRTESAGQRDNRDRFRLASEFAKQELLNADKRKHYERLLKKRPWLRNVYTVAIKTYMSKQETVVNRARKDEERKARRLIRRKVMLKRIQSNNRPALTSAHIRRTNNKSPEYSDVSFFVSNNRITNLPKESRSRTVQFSGP